jgi:WD40 repeat protein/heat shock protein HslJ
LTVWGWDLQLLADENVIGLGLSVRFGDDDRLSGTTGCRDFAGDYRVDRDRIRISRVESSGAACADPAGQELEKRYLDALEAAASFWLGEDLVITTDSGVELYFGREPVTASPPPGWSSYTHPIYGFRFHFPSDWHVAEFSESPNHVRLVQGSLALNVGFRWLEEDAQIARMGMPAGELVNSGGIEFLGAGISRDVLTYEGKVKAVLYNQAREMEQSNGLVFTLSLDEIGQDPYEAVDISPLAQAQIDWVVRSFQVLPKPDPTPDYPTTTPWPEAEPLQVKLTPYAQLGQGYVAGVAWIGSGEVLAVGTSLGVQLLDATAAWREIRFIDAGRPVWRLAASPDGETLAVTFQGGGDYITPPSLYAVATGQLLAEIPDETGLESIGMGGMAFSPDGEWLGTLDMEILRVWNAHTGNLVATLPRTGGALAFTPSGGRLLHDDGSRILVLDVATGEQLMAIDTGLKTIWQIALGPDGQNVAVLGEAARLFDLETGKQLAFLEDSQGAWGELLFGPHEDSVAVGGRVWETASGKLARSLELGANLQLPIFSPDLRFAVALPAVGEPDAVLLWDGVSGESMGPIYTSGPGARQFAFSPDGKSMAVVSSDLSIRLWAVALQDFIERKFSHTATDLHSLAFSPDGDRIAAADGNNILLWDSFSGGEPHILESHAEPVSCLAFARDGRTLFSGGADNQILQWDLETGEVIRALEGLRTDVISLAVSQDGSLLASGSNSVEYDRQGENPSYEGTPIRIWDAGTGEYLRGFDYLDVLSLEFSPDGDWLAANLTIDPALIDVRTGHQAQMLPAEANGTNVAVHPGGRLLAWGFGREIQIWDVAAGDVVFSIQGNTSQLYRVAFSPDGRFLAATGADGVLRLWRLEY